MGGHSFLGLPGAYSYTTSSRFVLCASWTAVAGARAARAKWSSTLMQRPSALTISGSISSKYACIMRPAQRGLRCMLTARGPKSLCVQVKRCPRARPHDWTQCPFAHPGEKAKRRDPRKYRYSGTACPEFRRVGGPRPVVLLPAPALPRPPLLLSAPPQNGCCRRGDACPFAHGVFECWLHPSRYRTQVRDG